MQSWRKSSHSSGGDNCIEVEKTDSSTVRVRDSHAPDTVLTVTPADWDAFVRGVKDGEFDD
jgi:hypothetical protein